MTEPCPTCGHQPDATGCHIVINIDGRMDALLREPGGVQKILDAIEKHVDRRPPDWER